MRLLLLLFLVHLIGHTPTFSQVVTVSEDISLRNDVLYSIIGKLKGNFILFQDKNDKFEVHAFDENLQKSWDKDIELENKRVEVLDVVTYSDNFYVFYHHRVKGERIIKVQQFDAAANMVDSATVKNFGRIFTTPNYELIESEDESKVLIYFSKQNSELNTLSFDVISMKLLWEEQLKPDNFTYYRDFRQILVTNKGDMFAILERDNQRSKQDKARLEIYELDGSSGQLRSFLISTQERLIYDIYFDYDNMNRRLVAGGMYSDKNLGRADGYFFLNIPPDDPDSHLLKFHEFNKTFVSKFLEKRSGKTRGMVETDIQEIVLRRDGGILIIGERNKEYERRTASNRGYYGRNNRPFVVDYYYDDLFVLSVHPDGREHWQTILHKKQYSQDDGAIYSSYFLAKTPTSLRLLFNDEIRPENTVSEYVITGNGQSDRNAVLSTENQQLRLRFRDGLQVASNEIIIPSERRNRLKLVKVRF